MALILDASSMAQFLLQPTVLCRYGKKLSIMTQTDDIETLIVSSRKIQIYDNSPRYRDLRQDKELWSKQLWKNILIINANIMSKYQTRSDLES